MTESNLVELALKVARITPESYLWSATAPYIYFVSQQLTDWILYPNTC